MWWLWQVLAVFVAIVWLGAFTVAVWICHEGFWRPWLVTNVRRMSLDEESAEHVHLSKLGGWYVLLPWGEERVYLGTFETWDEAAEARDVFLHLNAQEGPGTNHGS